MWDQLYLDLHLAVMTEGGAAYGAIRNGALAVTDGRIAYAGRARDLPGAPETLATRVERLGGSWVTPGLIDCHTHLVFAGSRAGEFEMRLEGAQYEEIARAGGGILSTVRATRAASAEALVAAARPRLEAMIRAGVTTVEIKSGYGLETETEFAMLEAATRLGAACGVRVRRTFLAMHALPPEHKDRRADYVRLVCEEMLPEAKARGLVDAVDAYCETIGFTPEEVERLFETARALGLPVRLHAEQLSDLGGAGLAARYGALSADHLEYISEDDVAAMARAGTVAVLLPGAYYFLNEKRRPPIELFRKHKVAMAVATDCNPGTAPIVSPTLAMNMTCVLFGLTPEEALAGMTRNAAKALGLQRETGALEPGKAADFAVWRVNEPAELSYWIGAAAPALVVAGGREVHRA
ncbi:imidazolonepropionase [Amphiplicatus metriothermophilus]|uniref:Imidazolonepropionase n=1 Tax=Amphiplicatus metriothermophilus TaxID=1519374 RepID=A0A239PZY1_9PROT|nr:imidazolonepropionase [Amphiplicatus metriothermophilus]MBB5519768.1 imidazolonepropionase [Amphiplicatus metriothermophilus]SNT75227.1 imidazolonepropionase [Amphiplicatus metriothermophilus]